MQGNFAARKLGDRFLRSPNVVLPRRWNAAAVRRWLEGGCFCLCGESEGRLLLLLITDFSIIPTRLAADGRSAVIDAERFIQCPEPFRHNAHHM